MAEERQTQRLILRQPTAVDRSLYHSHFTHPEVERWLRPLPLPPFNAGALDELVEGDQAHWSDHGFGPWIAIEWASEMRIEELVALVLPANVPSRRVAEKVGCGRNGEVDHAGLSHLLFRLRMNPDS